MDENLEAAAKGIFDRAKSIILSPKEEWPKIEAETKSQNSILTSYVIPLIAIGPIAGLIGGQLFGIGAFGISYKPPLMFSVVNAIVSFGLAIAVVYILAMIVNWLAPQFGGQSNKANAFKLAAYSGTAAWIAGIFSLIPMLSFFSLLGLYTLYLYYTGASPLMKVPADKALGYVAVIILGWLLTFFIVGALAVTITGAIGFSALSSAGSLQIGSNDSSMSGTVKIGDSTIDLGKIEQMGKQAEAIASGNATPVDVTKMQALLPGSIGAYQRTATESTGIGNVGGNAEGTYTSGDTSFKLSITDMSALGALAGIGAAMGVTQNREDADSYEKTGTVNGRMQIEGWNKTESRGKFGLVVANRFMIEADGEAASIDELKAAVATIDQSALASLAN